MRSRARRERPFEVLPDDNGRGLDDALVARAIARGVLVPAKLGPTPVDTQTVAAIRERIARRRPRRPPSRRNDGQAAREEGGPR